MICLLVGSWGMPYHLFLAVFWKQNKAVVAVGLHRSGRCCLHYLLPRVCSPCTPIQKHSSTNSPFKAGWAHSPARQRGCNRTPGAQMRVFKMMSPSCSFLVLVKLFWPSVVRSALGPVPQLMSEPCVTAVAWRIWGWPWDCQPHQAAPHLSWERCKSGTRRNNSSPTVTRTSAHIPAGSIFLTLIKAYRSENKSLCKHLLQDIKNDWAAMSWMRRLTTNPTLRVQPLTSLCSLPISCLRERGDLSWEGHHQNPESCPSRWTWTPPLLLLENATSPFGLLSSEIKLNYGIPGSFLPLSPQLAGREDWYTRSPKSGSSAGSLPRRWQKWPRQGMVWETRRVQNHKSSLSLGPELNNDKEALHSHPAAIGHFYRLNSAAKPSCQAGQYCHWMGTMAWRVASRASLPEGQWVPGTSAVGFRIL